MKFLMMILVSFLAFSALAVETLVVGEEVYNQGIRFQVCEDLVFDYYDYGEDFEDDDKNQTQFKEMCARTSIVLVSKVVDQFPEGMTPEGFTDEITTMLNLEVSLSAESELCIGTAIRTLPVGGFRVNDSGEITIVNDKSNQWIVDIEYCK